MLMQKIYEKGPKTNIVSWKVIHSYRMVHNYWHMRSMNGGKTNQIVVVFIWVSNLFEILFYEH